MKRALLDRIFLQAKVSHVQGLLQTRAPGLCMEVRPARRCSSCGQQGHNARTCLERDERLGCAPVDITFHEAASQDGYEQQGSADGSSFLQGLAPRLLGAAIASMSGSESEAQHASQLPHISRERRRGTPWTEEEHRAFLAGLEKLGKGDWRGISKDYVTTRTPTQVASHAQKYFIRHNNQSKRKRRTSLFDLKADADVLETGSAEATSASWPERTAQRSGSVSHAVHTTHTAPQRQASEQLDRNPAPTQSNAAAFPGMWYPQGPDLAFMQQYMQMTASQMDPAAMHMAQMAHFAAPQALSFPHFGVFPPPGMAEQFMAAYGAGFPPFAPDAMALAQQQAALVAAIYAQQQPQQPPEMVQQAAAAAAAFALNQAYQGAVPPYLTPNHRPDQYPDSPASRNQRQQSGMHAQQQAEKPAESSCAEGQQAMPLLPARVPVKDDPAFGHGKLYKPQASHAKASVPPPSTKFGGALTDNFRSASTLSRKSSSESIPPPVTDSPGGGGGQIVSVVAHDLAAAETAADGVATCQS